MLYSPDSPEPDKLELGIRFGCGFIFGVGVAGYFSLRGLGGELVYALIGIGVFATICGVLVVKMGDRFFHSLWNR